MEVSCETISTRGNLSEVQDQRYRAFADFPERFVFFFRATFCFLFIIKVYRITPANSTRGAIQGAVYRDKNHIRG